MKYLIQLITLSLLLQPSPLLADQTGQRLQGIPQYEVIDDSYQVCLSESLYRQLLNFSLYGVGKPPTEGCFKADSGTKAIILQCPESDIILCQFRLESDGTNTIEVWASKVMLREIE